MKALMIMIVIVLTMATITVAQEIITTATTNNSSSTVEVYLTSQSKPKISFSPSLLPDFLMTQGLVFDVETILSPLQNVSEGWLKSDEKMIIAPASSQHIFKKDNAIIFTVLPQGVICSVILITTQRQQIRTQSSANVYLKPRNDRLWSAQIDIPFGFLCQAETIGPLWVSLPNGSDVKVKRVGWGSVVIYNRPGEVTGDENVDIFDLVAVGQRLGETGFFPGSPEDQNNDVICDINDMFIVANHFKESSSSAAPANITALLNPLTPKTRQAIEKVLNNIPRVTPNGKLATKWGSLK